MKKFSAKKWQTCIKSCKVLLNAADNEVCLLENTDYSFPNKNGRQKNKSTVL